MSRIPPGLLYLTIYNPALRPAIPTQEHDEDAEEQAQILFYTARERAVSRDRILRQVGLCKALISFSELFNPENVCSNVHSQARRMVMLSPEPDFWIHACFEVAKTPRPAAARSKHQEKGKGKDHPTREDVVYDYHDGSVHDLSLRAHILLGYELFKLTHGTLTSILSSLGQNALELQLERFFTVWAWKWDIVQDTNFSAYLGVPRHPLCPSLTPVLNGFGLQCPEDTVPFVLVPPYLVPSTRFSTARYPMCLIQHIMSRIPPPLPLNGSNPTLSTTPEQRQSTSMSGTGPDERLATSDKKPHDGSAQGSTFLAMPNMNVKWNWPGYLTFGKGSSAKTSQVSPSSQDVCTTSPENSKVDEETADEDQRNVVDVDAQSLQEAISTDNIHIPASPLDTSPASSAKPLEARSTQIEAITKSKDPETPVTGRDTSSPTVSEEELFQEERKPMPSYLSMTVHLSETGEISDTRRRRIWHLTSNELTFALVTEYDSDAEQLPPAETVIAMLDRIRSVIVVEKQKAAAEATIPSAAKILQPEDRHVISAGGFTRSPSAGLSSETEQLFNGQQMLHSDLDVLEVFSRGQNPQHWHISKRGLGVGVDGLPVEGEVYMQIARKESTLTDVDNELAGVMRRFLEQ
ncbi:hypothetical protein BKA93DRAFT_808924 [Sparassis latifolia]